MSTPSNSNLKRVGVLISGRGSNLRALIDAKRMGKLPRTVFSIVISNNPDAPGLSFAKQENILTAVIDHRDFKGDRAAHDAAIVKELRKHRIDWVVLAGYMRLLTPTFVEAFRHRIINIHPSLLPAFPGLHAQRQAVNYGVKKSGCTVHLVDEKMDDGPIISQRTVPVHADDSEESLASRILAQEHIALPQALALATHERLLVADRRVFILPGVSTLEDSDRSVRQFLPVLVATGNQHKVKEIRSILSELALSFLDTKSFPVVTEPVEDAGDFLGNARIKARHWHEKTGLWSLADDSGLVIDALDGRPGIHSARYAETNQERIDKVLREMDGIPESNRAARFVCVCVLIGPDGEEYRAEGILEGKITTKPSGEGGFGYDPIFEPEGFKNKTLAEMTEDTKNNISHRARSLFGMKPILERLASRYMS